MTADRADGDPFARALDRLVAEAAAAEATRERVHERTLRGVAEAEATFVGIAVDLAERGAVVVVRTAPGRSARGRVRAVGRDFLALHEEGRAPALLALGAVTSIRPEAGGSSLRRDAAGARPAPLDLVLASLLSELAAERPRVQVVVAGEDPITGDLRAAGADVVTLRLDGAARPVLHLRLAAVAEIVLLDL